MSDPTRKRRWLRVSLATLFVAVTIAALLGALREYPRERVLHPETGFAFPQIARVERIDLIRFHSDATGEVMGDELPSQYWPEILQSLSPSEYDPQPAKWVVLGELQITQNDGTSMWVALFETGELGAFAVAKQPWRNHRYYRGGNSHQLKAALINAIQQSRPPRAA